MKAYDVFLDSIVRLESLATVLTETQRAIVTVNNAVLLETLSCRKHGVTHFAFGCLFSVQCHVRVILE